MSKAGKQQRKGKAWLDGRGKAGGRGGGKTSGGLREAGAEGARIASMEAGVRAEAMGVMKQEVRMRGVGLRGKGSRIGDQGQWDEENWMRGRE